MGDVLSESDLARILAVPESTVRRLFEEGLLTGTQHDDGWRTTEQILEGDTAILIEGERIARLREGIHPSPWSDALREDDPGHLAPAKVAALIKRLETTSSQT